MTKRILRASFSVALVTLLLVTAMILGVMSNSFDSRIRQELAVEAELAAQGVAAGGIQYLEKLQVGENRITLVAEDGTVVFDNLADPETMDNHLGREEIKEALESGKGEGTRISETLSRKTIYYALRTDDGSVLRISAVQSSAFSMLVRMAPSILLILALALGLSAILSSRAAKRIIKPLNELDLEYPEMCDTYDELAPLLSRIHSQNKTIEQQMNGLKRAQKEFMDITSQMNEGLIVIGPDTEILSVNASAKRILGVSGNCEGRNVLDLNSNEGFADSIDAVFAGESVRDILQLSGRSYQLIGDPIYENGDVHGAILLLMDVTEKTQWEKMRSEFTANVSHELKTPLTSISGIAEIIKNGLVMPIDIPHFAERIYSEAQRLITLVNDIIKLSQLDERAVPLEKEKIDLYDVSERVIEQLRDAAETKRLSVMIQGDHTTVTGVRQIVEEMVYNLVDNAIKYNKDGGKVTVTVAEEPESVRLTVEDTGIGIPEDDLSRVFERFYRVDKSHSKAIGGTGLGLSIVKHGAAYHGAKTELESRYGEGTKISIMWPCA